jgi:hypothetical protein
MRELAGLLVVFAALVTVPVAYVWPLWWVASAAGLGLGLLLFYSGPRSRSEPDLAQLSK